jgi:hypothetical protein
LSDTLSLFSPLNVRDQVSHPYRATGKIIGFVYSNFYFSRPRTRRQKASGPNGSKRCHNVCSLLVASELLEVSSNSSVLWHLLKILFCRLRRVQHPDYSVGR